MERTIIFGIIWITFCVSIFLAWYFTHKAKHKERLLMIEKGLNPNEDLNRDGGIKTTLLKVGIVLVGLGIGLAIIAILVEFHAFGKSNAVPMSILALSCGIALIIATRLSSTKR